MSYELEIRNNETGETRRYVCNQEWDDDSLFFWTDGNGGCDCYRLDCFNEAAGDDTQHDEPCCSTYKYTITKAVLHDGSEVLVDA